MFFAGFEVLAALFRNVPVFWGIPPCRLVYV